MSFGKNFFGHLFTIMRHRRAVISHSARAGILLRGLVHDLSKYSPTEFVNGVKNFQGTRSPNEEERRAKGYSEAWLHHKGRNRHHFEYWTDYNPATKTVQPVKMPLKYVAEMFCDRVAASKVYLGKSYTEEQPLKYFGRGKPTRSIHPETSDLLEQWLIMLSEKGEDYTLRHIRRLIKKEKSKT